MKRRILPPPHLHRYIPILHKFINKLSGIGHQCILAANDGTRVDKIYKVLRKVAVIIAGTDHIIGLPYCLSQCLLPCLATDFV